MNTSQFNVYYIDTENRPHVEQILPDVKKEKKKKSLYQDVLIFL